MIYYFLQALSDKDLKWMNRDHDTETALNTLNMIYQHSKLKSFNIDLIFGRPNLSNESWKSELLKIFTEFPKIPHLSLYDLTPERGTKLWEVG